MNQFFPTCCTFYRLQQPYICHKLEEKSLYVELNRYSVWLVSTKTGHHRVSCRPSHQPHLYLWRLTIKLSSQWQVNTTYPIDISPDTKTRLIGRATYLGQAEMVISTSYWPTVDCLYTPSMWWCLCLTMYSLLHPAGHLRPAFSQTSTVTPSYSHCLYNLAPQTLYFRWILPNA